MLNIQCRQYISEADNNPISEGISLGLLVKSRSAVKSIEIYERCPCMLCGVRVLYAYAVCVCVWGVRMRCACVCTIEERKCALQ